MLKQQTVSQRAGAGQEASGQKKAASLEREAAVVSKIRHINNRAGCSRSYSSAAAGAAGTLLLHAGQYETLPLGKIDGRARKHLVRAVLQKHLQAAFLESRVARLGDFGYVHSQ